MINDDLKAIGVTEKEWYKAATTSRSDWKAICSTELELAHTSHVTHQAAPEGHPVTCDTCQRTFHREGDKKRHKCTQDEAH